MLSNLRPSRRSLQGDPSIGSRERFPNQPYLDLLRVFFTILVFFQHAYNFGLRHLGGAGVAGFFVLSGFLITTLLLKEEARHGRVCYPSFLVRRMLRIWPAYFMCLVVLNGVVGFSTLEYRALVSDMTFTRTFLGRDLFTDNGGHLWSIAVEEQFYFVWPVAFIFLKNIYVRATFLCAGLLYLSVYRGYISDRFIPILVGCLFGVIYHKIRSGVVQRYLPLLWLPALLAFMFLAVGSHGGGCFMSFLV